MRYWDTRSPTPALQVQLPDRCYALSCTHPLLVVGTAERHIQVYDLNNPSAPFKQLQSPLKYQTRTVAAFPDKSGYLIGSIEGRVAVQHVDEPRVGHDRLEAPWLDEQPAAEVHSYHMPLPHRPQLVLRVQRHVAAPHLQLALDPRVADSRWK